MPLPFLRPTLLTSPFPSHQFCICWIVLAAILISAASAAEEANGPDSNYETGVMSVILIGLTAIPGVLTLFWTAYGWREVYEKVRAREGDKAGTGDGTKVVHTV